MPGRAERKELSRIARRQEDRTAERQEAPGDVDAPRHANHSSDRRKKKTFELEWRYRERTPMPASWGNWKTYRRYATEKQRAVALENLNKKAGVFEYRMPPEA